MTIKNKDLFGLGAVSDELIERSFQEPGKLISAYCGGYRDITFPNGLILIRQFFPQQDGRGEKSPKKEEVGLELSFDGGTEADFLASEIVKQGNLEAPETVSMNPISSKREYFSLLPINPVHAWLQENLIAYGEVQLKVFFLAERMCLRSPGKLDDQTEPFHSPHGFSSYEKISEEELPLEIRQKVSFEGEVIESRLLAPICFKDGDMKIESEPLRLFICLGNEGKFCILGKESLLSQTSRKYLDKQGAILQAIGFLIGDALAGRYKFGAIWDGEHLCNHLRTLSSIHDSSILSEKLSPKSEVLINGQDRVTGVVPMLKAITSYLYGFNILYSRVMDVRTGIILPALSLRSEMDGSFSHWIIPECDPKGSIEKIRVEKRSEEIQTIFETDDFERFLNPELPELRPFEEKSKNNTVEESNYPINGDAKVFPPEHDEFGSELIASFFESDSEYETFVREFFAHCKTLPNSDRTIEGVQLLTLTDPTPEGEPSLLGFVSTTSETEDWHLVTFMPKLPGLAVRLKVLGTCQWKKKVGGEVALMIGNDVITAVVTDFDLKQNKMKIGSKQFFRLSASIEMLEICKLESILIDEGPFFEEALEEFLEENPDKTEKDFGPFEVSIAGVHMLFPREVSTRFEFMSPVLSIKRMMLFMQEVVRLEIFLHRAGKEVKTYLYGTPQQIPEGLKEGDEIQGILRLYADPIAESVN